MQRPQAVGILVSVMLVTLLGTIGIAMPYPILAPLFMSGADPGLTKFLGIHPKLLLGGVLALYPLGLLVGGAFLGAISDRHGRRRVMLISLVVSTAGYGFSAWALIQGSYPLFALSRLLTGISEGNITIARAIAVDLHPQVDRKRALAMLYSATYTGWLVGPLLGGFLMPLGAEIAFLVAGGSVALALVMVVFTLPEDSPAAPSTARLALWSDNSAVLLRQPEVRAFFYVHVAFCLGLNAFYEFYPLWLVESFDYDSKSIALSTLVLTTFMIASSALLSAPVTGRLGLPRTLSLGTLLMGMLVTATTVVPSQGVMILFGVLGPVIAITNNVFPTLAAEEFGHLGQGRVMGLLAATWCSSATVLAVAGSVLSLGRATHALAFGALCLLAAPVLSRFTRGASPATARVR